MECLSAELPAKYNHAVGRYGESFAAVTSADVPPVYLKPTILVWF